MESIYSEGYGHGKGAGILQQGRNKESPIIPSISIQNAQNPHRPDERLYMPEPQLGYALLSSGLILLKKNLDSVVIGFG